MKQTVFQSKTSIHYALVKRSGHNPRKPWIVVCDFSGYTIKRVPARSYRNAKRIALRWIRKRS